MNEPANDAHSLEIALRIAQTQNRELRKLLEQTEDELDEARKWCNIHWEGVRSTGKHCADAMNELQKTTEERDEARKLAEDMHQFDPQQRTLPWVRPSTAEEKLDLAVKALQKIDQVGGAMRGEWASEKAAETLNQIQ